jgi:amino acid transporter
MVILTTYYHIGFQGGKMVEKPTAAFALSLIGGVFILLGGIVYVAASSWVGSLGFGLGASVLAGLGVFGLICGILTILGAVWINSGEEDKVRNGSILVLIFSIVSWFGAAGGFFIGFILGLIGAILGLTWKPSTTEKAPPPSTPP